MPPLPDSPAAAPPLDFALLVEASTDIVAVTDLDTTIRYVNGASERVLGYPAAALVGRRVRELLTPAALATLDARLAELAASRPARREPRVYEFVASDGSPRFLEVLATDLRDNPRIGGLCVVARDATDRVVAERERASTLERRRMAARVARVGLWEWDPETHSMLADDSVREILRQHADQEWTGPEEFIRRFVPEDQPLVGGAIQRALGGTEAAECTARLALPQGQVRWLHLYGQRIDSAQGRPRVLGLVMDVSAQKRAESELAERRDTLSLASSAAGLCTWTWRPDANLIDFDERFADLTGLPPGTRSLSLEAWRALVHADDVDMMLALADDLAAGRGDSFDVAHRLRRPDGGWRWVLGRGRVASRDGSGQATRIYGITLDIDERMRTERELAAQRLRLRLALDATGLGLWDWDHASRQLVTDTRYREIIGATAEDLAADPFALEQRLHPDDRPALTAAMRECLYGGRADLSLLGRLRRPDGTVAHVRLQGAVSGRDRKGQPIRLTGTIADVTESEHGSELARMGEAVARVGSYEFQLETRRLTWSEGARRIFRLPASYRPSFEDTRRFVAPGSRERMQQLIRAAREHGEPFDAEMEALTAGGESIWVRMIGEVESFADRPARVFGIVQDITARKQLERRLLEVANREQQRLGSELHDGLGQELAGMAMIIEALAQQLAGTRPAVAAQFERLRELVGESIQSTRALAHGLAPVSLRRGGLEGALRMLARQVEAGSGIRLALEFELDTPLTLGEVAGNHLYRIAQEAVGNAIRHGEARRITLELQSRPGEVSLEIRDDGRGIAAGAELQEGFGLRSMRYRAQELEGTLDVSSRPTGGLRVSITCPQPAG